MSQQATSAPTTSPNPSSHSALWSLTSRVPLPRISGKVLVCFIPHNSIFIELFIVNRHYLCNQGNIKEAIFIVWQGKKERKSVVW